MHVSGAVCKDVDEEMAYEEGRDEDDQQGGGARHTRVLLRHDIRGDGCRPQEGDAEPRTQIPTAARLVS